MSREGPADPVETAAPLELRPPRHRVDRRAVGWWTARAVSEALVPLAVVLVAVVAAPDARGWLGPVLAGAALAAVGYVVAMPRWRYRIHRWETTAEAVYASSGWLLQEWRVAPLSRVQTVDMLRGPLQQLFGLATVTVTTASAKGAVTIDGLAAERAAEIVHQLTETTQAIPGDAT